MSKHTDPKAYELAMQNVWAGTNEQKLSEALSECREALESVWAAIGDALLSGKGINAAYANNVANECRKASNKAEAALAAYPHPTKAAPGEWKAGDTGLLTVKVVDVVRDLGRGTGETELLVDLRSEDNGSFGWVRIYSGSLVHQQEGQ